MSYDAALARIGEIQQIMSAAAPSPAPPPATVARPASATSEVSFANVLSQQQQAAARDAAPTARAASPAQRYAPPGGGATVDAMIDRAAAAENVDADLLRALVRAESNFDANATSPAGAQGLTQLMPATARSLGVTDPLDPQQSLAGGAKYLRQMLNQFHGDVRLALAAYNAGPGAVARYGGIPPYRETQGYVQKVTGYYEQYKAARA